MGQRERFLGELRHRTTAHLSELAHESGVIFGGYLDMPEAGPRIYARLVERFQLDGAQEIGAALVDLFDGTLDSGAVTLTDREYRGLRLVDEEFGSILPPRPAASLHDLIVSLSRSDIR